MRRVSRLSAVDRRSPRGKYDTRSTEQSRESYAKRGSWERWPRDVSPLTSMYYMYNNFRSKFLGWIEPCVTAHATTTTLAVGTALEPYSIAQPSHQPTTSPVTVLVAAPTKQGTEDRDHVLLRAQGATRPEVHCERPTSSGLHWHSRLCDSKHRDDDEGPATRTRGETVNAQYV